ncbi:hypothetical protein [Nocardioides marmotae]|uniref:Uncharacterized protein n=1 Tax=Nocardioides marmotae TaxID=2663857 RepID=A0A6I3JFY9_9ACTN|nr:hypothetical protein [Nocardioides marmotae]MCR6033343.1 hypothetical protein [Gordonia jinghuaiqii]MBC9734095.1 hypothetical protein [Nocardioides marmotae]MTB85198.1 hypothetical protein [Nocardioides marmotae]MTB97000.1 hypothetical protein [Nocardioides marmotae]QKE00622.1 hypothetical protein HPC71_05650 [Nocardioides marmotae]
MNSLIKTAVLATAVVTSTAALATTAAGMVPAPERSAYAIGTAKAVKPVQAVQAVKPPKAQRTDFVRYCDDGATYQTHKLKDDGPAFIEGTQEKFINIDSTYDGPKRVYTCGYIVVQDPTFTGTVRSIRVKR